MKARLPWWLNKLLFKLGLRAWGPDCIRGLTHWYSSCDKYVADDPQFYYDHVLSKKEFDEVHDYLFDKLKISK